MSAKEIKLLIGKFNDAHENSDYAEFMSRKECLSKQEREEWEEDADMSENELYYLAEKIKELKPSKYMMEKYSELDYILTFA